MCPRRAFLSVLGSEFPNKVRPGAGRFRVWGDEFEVRSGSLDELLNYSEELEKEVVLLHENVDRCLHRRTPSLPSYGGAYRF